MLQVDGEDQFQSVAVRTRTRSRQPPLAYASLITFQQHPPVHPEVVAVLIGKLRVAASRLCLERLLAVENGLLELDEDSGTIGEGLRGRVVGGYARRLCRGPCMCWTDGIRLVSGWRR